MESPAKGVGATAPSIQEGIPVPWKTMGALVHGRPRHAVVQANLESSSFKGGIVVLLAADIVTAGPGWQRVGISLVAFIRCCSSCC